MNILFINPPTMNFYKDLGLNLMPLGIGYLAAMLQKEGHSVYLLDLQSNGTDVATIDYENYDVVGISSDTPRFNTALRIGQEARRHKVPVIFGGPHVTFLDMEPIEKNAADYVIRGEGEYILPNLLNALLHDRDIEKIRGLTYRTNGIIHRNPAAPLIPDLDSLPIPARHLFSNDGYFSHFERRPVTTVLTSRGCPFDCYFCSASRIAGLKWRTRSLDSIFDELEFLQKEGYSSFIFVDDNFTLDYHRTMNFCEEVLSRHWDIRWWCFSRVDTVVRHPEMVKKMAETGNRSVFLGLESGNQDTLDIYEKKSTPKQQQQAVQILKKNKVQIFGSFILGERHETKKMIQKTIKFARKLNIDNCQFSLLTPYPGSRLYEQLDQDEQLTTKNWDQYDGVHIVFKNSQLSVKKMQRLLRQAYLGFYLRLSRIPGALLGIAKEPARIRVNLSRLYSGISIFNKIDQGTGSSNDSP